MMNKEMSQYEFVVFSGSSFTSCSDDIYSYRIVQVVNIAITSDLVQFMSTPQSKSIAAVEVLWRSTLQLMSHLSTILEKQFILAVMNSSNSSQWHKYYTHKRISQEIMSTTLPLWHAVIQEANGMIIV
jgi:hypothetical protein